MKIIKSTPLIILQLFLTASKQGEYSKTIMGTVMITFTAIRKEAAKQKKHPDKYK
jgi:bacteriorhodopsin